jgi:hypothetical protein
MRTPADRRWFLLGLFLTTFAALSLEVLDTRLLSVVNFYHLSFFAVSLAMFGMSAGAVHVYLAGDRLRGDGALRGLARYALVFTASVPLLHLVNLKVPLDAQASLTGVLHSVIPLVALAVPFYLAGIVVSIALTRIPGAIGQAYSVDLLGAALGCLLVPLLLSILDLTSAVFLVGGLAGLGTLAFQRLASTPAGPERRGARALTAALIAGGLLHAAFPGGQLIPASTTGHIPARENMLLQSWNSHSYVTVRQPVHQAPPVWGPGRLALPITVDNAFIHIDAGAGTSATGWDGDLASLEWVGHDITALPYVLRPGGRAGVIGVGGGRDILTALWARCESITGIELNRTIVDLHYETLHDFTRIAEQPSVRLVHDEARSWLTRTDERFDVIQMSLIDTWAATGAGAFTLSENGLYTVEGWGVFLDALRPGGLVAVSRWFDPGTPTETARLLSLAAGSLLRRGVTRPADHIALLHVGNIATAVVSNEPLSARDLDRLQQEIDREGYGVISAPGRAPVDEQLAAIVAADSWDALIEAGEHDWYDLSPPTDSRPFFFNMLKPAGALRAAGSSQGVISGNVQATTTLLLLGLIAVVMAFGVALGPLARAGLPRMPRGPFVAALAYFAVIGTGFMLLQIGLLQRFSVYLGHPTYSLPVILFTMILFAGIGSSLSDRVGGERLGRAGIAVPLAIAAMIGLLALLMTPVLEGTLQAGMLARCAVVVALVAPVSLPLGFCFPLGLRLIGRIADDASPWMWGVNGAFSVLASVIAVSVSIWLGIQVNLYLAIALYLLLVLPWAILWRAGAAVTR